MAYRFQNRVPTQQYQAQVKAGLGMLEFSEEQVSERMARIQVPVLLLFGEYDEVVPPGNAALMADKLPNAEVKILPAAGHLFPIERPEATVAAIREFLESK
jgi:pimeloyl-ACP methyl ester carboxylesterase